VSISSEPGILFIELTRPEKRNALNGEMIAAISEAINGPLAAQTRVIVLSGAPGYFCAGADISAYKDSMADAAALATFTNTAKALCTSLTASHAIVIAVVDGIAMGGGLELVLASDLVVASDRSRFGLPEIKLGLIPGWGGTQRLVRFLGPNRAKESILTGDPFGVDLALTTGLVNRVVAADELGTTARDLARGLADRAPLALRAAKRAITAAYDPTASSDNGSALETQLLLELFASADGNEGVAAFVEKRPAVFAGN
jgi:enoyl-CoA hydratase/carnithine racemase